MEVLACPVCKGPLELDAEIEEGEEIVAGGLLCKACDTTYPIVDSIPNLLPADQRALQVGQVAVRQAAHPRPLGRSCRGMQCSRHSYALP